MESIEIQQFNHIKKGLETGMISTRNLPFEEEYYKKLKDMFWEMGCSRDDFFNPLYIWGVVKANDGKKTIPQTQVDIIKQSIIALEIQLKRQTEIYGNIPEPFEKNSADRSMLVRKYKPLIEEYIVSKMNQNKLFIVSRNRKYRGTFSFHDIDMDFILAHYTTLPMLKEKIFSELDILFIDLPKDYARVPSQKKERGKIL